MMQIFGGEAGIAALCCYENAIHINREEEVQRFAKLTAANETWQFRLNFRQHCQFLLCDFGDTARYSVLDINRSVAL